jgi:hypothetical protein
MKTFSFTRPILALLSMCAFCYASLSAQILDSTKADSVQKPSAQTLDSTKADSVQKARENWYWAHGGIGVGYIPEFRAYLPIGIGATLGNFIVSAKLRLVREKFCCRIMACGDGWLYIMAVTAYKNHCWRWNI